jgi:F420H(2)-dependent quinone reductase
MRPAAIVGSALLLAALSFGAITLYALEGHDVVVLHTRGPDGTARATRTWVADDGDSLWVEAAFRARPFYQQLLANPEVEVERGGIVRRYRAVPVPNPEGHLRIRALLAAKYGWADRWVGLLQDTSASVAVKLEPE